MMCHVPSESFNLTTLPEGPLPAYDKLQTGATKQETVLRTEILFRFVANQETALTGRGMLIVCLLAAKSDGR
jgi:hypothetical protein